MEAIHLKTVDPVAQSLLRLAGGQGLELSWDRFEALQPQDGFVRTGLSCAFGCMHGPCRIDPFGRGAKAGVCGLGRDAMVAASLLRLCLGGGLEAGAANGEAGAAAALLRRPQAGAGALVRQALSLAKAVAAQADDGAGSYAIEVGYGLLAAKPAIGVAGTISAEAAAVLADGKVRAVSLGAWINVNGALLPFACTSGEAELALVSRRVHTLLAGGDADPGLIALAEKLGIPVVQAGSRLDPSSLADAATRLAASVPPGFSTGIEATQSGKGTVHCGAKSIAKALQGSAPSIALLGGFDTPHQSLGWLQTEVAPALMADGCTVAAWGDAALWLAKAGLAAASGKQAVLVGPRAGVVDVVKAVGAGRIKGACFTALRDDREVALALGLACLGVRVLVATPLPVWGSKAVMATLDAALAECGGSLTHVDKPIGADEIADWFRG